MTATPRNLIDTAHLRAAINGNRMRLAEALDLIQQGRRVFCPFCQADGRPHATADLSLEAGFRCHRCGWHGDGFRLVMDTRRCGFPEALRFVQGVYGGGYREPLLAAVRKSGKIHATVEAAARAARWIASQRDGRAFSEVGRWAYEDGAGHTVAYVLRFDEVDGLRDEQGKVRKSYIPVHAHEGGWRVGDPPGRWPLYALAEVLMSAGPVFVCEGEKACDAGRKAGLTCTTSAHGAKSPIKTDWSPLAGRDVVVLPDNDESGQAYALAVEKILGALTPHPRVKFLDLPGLAPKGDLYDFLTRP